MSKKLFFCAVILLLLVGTASGQSPTAANADFNGSGEVEFNDFLLFVEKFNTRQGDDEYEARYDLDSSGEVAFADFLVFVGFFGETVPAFELTEIVPAEGMPGVLIELVGRFDVNTAYQVKFGTILLPVFAQSAERITAMVPVLSSGSVPVHVVDAVGWESEHRSFEVLALPEPRMNAEQLQQTVADVGVGIGNALAPLTEAGVIYSAADAALFNREMAKLNAAWGILGEQIAALPPEDAALLVNLLDNSGALGILEGLGKIDLSASKVVADDPFVQHRLLFQIDVINALLGQVSDITILGSIALAIIPDPVTTSIAPILGGIGTTVSLAEVMIETVIPTDLQSLRVEIKPTPVPVGGTSDVIFFGNFSTESDLPDNILKNQVGDIFGALVKYIIKKKVPGGEAALKNEQVDEAVGKIVGVFSGILTTIGFEEKGLEDLLSEEQVQIDNVPLDMSLYHLTWTNIGDVVLRGILGDSIINKLLGWTGLSSLLEKVNFFTINEPVQVADETYAEYDLDNAKLKGIEEGETDLKVQAFRFGEPSWGSKVIITGIAAFSGLTGGPVISAVAVSIARLKYSLEYVNLNVEFNVSDVVSSDYPKLGLPDGAIARFGKGYINDVAYSSDGQLLAVASSIGIWLYDVATTRELALLTGHTRSVSSVSFAPDGKTLASGGRDGTIRLWEVESGAQTAVWEGHWSSVNSVSFSPDGKTLASGVGSDILGSGYIRLWDVASGRQTAILVGHTDIVSSVSFSPDGKTLASGSGSPYRDRDRTIRLWDVESGRQTAVLEGHRGEVFSVSFSPDGRTLASGSKDSTIRLWDVESGRQTAVLVEHTSSVYSVSFSPDGRTLASGSLVGTIRLWDVESGRQTAVLEGHTNWVESVSFSPDGRTLASGGWDGTIRLWEVGSRRQTAVLEGHTGNVYSVSFSPDGRTLASGSGSTYNKYRDGTIRLWDVASGGQTAVLEGHTGSVSSVSFSPDGKTLASAGSRDGTIRLWDVASGRQTAVLEGHRGEIFSVSFSPDGKTLASGGWDSTILLWELGSRRQTAVLEGHWGEIYSVSFSPDGKTLASAGSRDETIRLWEVASGRQTAVLEGHTGSVSSVSFSPDGKTLASGSRDGTIRLWEVASGRQTAVLEGHTGSVNSVSFWVNSVSFSPDGRTLASGSGDLFDSGDITIRLWEVASGRQTAILEGHTGSVFSVSFSPDGQTLASGSNDGTILLWQVEP